MLQQYQYDYRKYLIEALGTFFLVFTIGCCATIGSNVFFAAAAILAAFIYAGAPISGAHYNPAVTLGVWLRRRLDTAQVVPYVLSQLGGAVIAALLIRLLIGHLPIVEQILRHKLQNPLLFASHHVLIVEFLFTFALVFVVLQVATSKTTRGNSYYGFAIGLTLLAGILSVGTISGAAFNPAVALGVVLMGLSPWSTLWIYIVSNFAGGAIAAYVFNYLNPDDL